MSARLDAYLRLEQAARALDELGDPIADDLRDEMDPIWYAMTEEEPRFLDGRVLR